MILYGVNGLPIKVKSRIFCSFSFKIDLNDIPEFTVLILQNTRVSIPSGHHLLVHILDTVPEWMSQHGLGAHLSSPTEHPGDQL